MRRKVYLLLLALAVVNVYAEDITLQQNNVVIVVPQGECSQVCLAAEALQRDFQKVMGFKPAMVNTLGTTGGVELVVVNQAADGIQALGGAEGTGRF